jgi:hypothetical protein
MLAAARSAAGEPLPVLQLPMNFRDRRHSGNTGPDGARTALGRRRRARLGVLATGRSNAIIGGGCCGWRRRPAGTRTRWRSHDPALPAARRSGRCRARRSGCCRALPASATSWRGPAPGYVDDAMAVETWEPLADPLAVLRLTRDALAAS